MSAPNSKWKFLFPAVFFGVAAIRTGVAGWTIAFDRRAGRDGVAGTWQRVAQYCSKIGEGLGGRGLGEFCPQ